jgi:DNA-binding response OmpR family regulator
MKFSKIKATIDDYAHIRQMLYEVLKDQGYHITTAPDGEVALEILSSHNFDLVITDLNMGRVNGIEVLKKAKSLSPQPRVIIATGNPDVTYVIEALRCKADDYLLKPFRIADLLDRISQCLTNSAPQSLHYC